MRLRALAVAVSIVGAALMPAPARAQADLQRGPWVPSWTIAYGGYRQVEDISVVGDDAWGVDYTVVTAPTGQIDQTAFVRAENGTWRVAQIVDGAGMQSVAMRRADLGFAVGDRGAIYRYDGRLWRPTVSPTDQELTAVAFGSEDEAWAIGERATILRWDGADWTIEETPIGGSRLTALAAVAPGDAWVASLGGQLLHYDGGTWQVAEAPLLQRSADIAFASPTYGMAVGLNVLLFDGAWREIESPADSHTSVAFWQDTAYVVGDTRLWRYRADAGWDEPPLTGVHPSLRDGPFLAVRPAVGGVWALAADGATLLLHDEEAEYVRPGMTEGWALDMVTTEFGWAGGRAATAAFVGTDGGAWTREVAAPPGTVVWALDLVSEESGWAVGQSTEEPAGARMWRWDGEGWSDWAIDKTWEIGDIEMLDEGEGWASKGNVIARWDGQEWRSVPGTPPGASSGGLGVLRDGGETRGWFGTFGGMYELSGETWVPITLTRQSLVVDIEVPDPREGWAVMAEALYRYDGSDWSEVDLPLRPSSVLLDVDAPERSNAWVLADPDGLYHWDGTSWERHDLSPFGGMFAPSRIQALRLEEDSLATDVWVVGRYPSIGRYRVVTPVGSAYLPVTGKRFRW